MIWSANRYQKLPPVNLKRVGILTDGADYSGLNAVNQSAILTHGAVGKFGTMVALKSQNIVLTPMKSLDGVVHQVPNNSQMVRTAELIGVCLGR
jgi:hypothetical protein